MTILVPPSLQSLPASLSIEGAVSIVIEEGIPIFRASQTIQHRIETLLQKQAEDTLTPEEIDEFDRYQDIDGYLGFVNRTIRSLYIEDIAPIRHDERFRALVERE
jgi:ribosome biogenesis SPOUT family RNA methylase Rps3